MSGPRRRSRPRKPLLNVREILRWVDDHHHRTGHWPSVRCGRIQGTRESWRGIDASLHRGTRGLEAASSLATLLSEHRGVRSTRNLPKLSERKIMRWAKGAQAHSRSMAKKSQKKRWSTPYQSRFRRMRLSTWEWTRAHPSRSSSIATPARSSSPARSFV